MYFENLRTKCDAPKCPYSLYVFYPRPPLLQCVSKSTDPCYLNDRSIPTLILLIFFAKVLSFVIFFFLFFRNRGAHNFWLSGKVRESPSSPNGLINLIHYDDAAKAVVLAFEDGVNSQEVFLGKY